MQLTKITLALLLITTPCLASKKSLSNAFPPKITDRLWAIKEICQDSTLNFFKNGQTILGTATTIAMFAPLINSQYRQECLNGRRNIIGDFIERGCITYLMLYGMSFVCFPLTHAWHSWAQQYTAAKEHEQQNQQAALERAQKTIEQLHINFQCIIDKEHNGNQQIQQAKLIFGRKVQMLLQMALDHRPLYDFDLKNAFSEGTQFEIPFFQEFQESFKDLISMFLAPCTYRETGYKGDFIINAAERALEVTREKWAPKP